LSQIRRRAGAVVRVLSWRAGPPSPASGEEGWRLATVLRLAAVLLALAATPAFGCTVARRAVLPVRFQAGHPLVSAMLDGHLTSFILDTGAQRSLLTPEAVRRLDLKLDPWVGTTVVGIGGTERHRNARVASLTLGGLALRQNTPLRGLSLSVGTIPKSQMGGVPVDGILGRDVLAAFDLSLDLGHRRITLYRVRACSGRFLPWERPYAAVPALPGYRTALAIPVRADGRVLRALIDTGSTGIFLSGAGMARLGLTPAALAREPTGQATGIGPRTVPVRVYRLGWLAVGASIARNVPVVVAPVILTPTLDLLLGMDWLTAHLVWLSYATGQVFVAR
jgi:predicted aspartyl protease